MRATQKDWFPTFKSPRFKRVLFIICLYILSLFIPLLQAYTRLPIALAYCRVLPITVTFPFAGSYIYKAPGDRGYGFHPLVRSYYCTAEDAAAAGYRDPSDSPAKRQQDNQ